MSFFVDRKQNSTKKPPQVAQRAMKYNLPEANSEFTPENQRLEDDSYPFLVGGFNPFEKY